jgi:type VI secretion system secreted protein VgrG
MFQCAFTAMQSTQNYRPARVTPKSLVYGPQTAVVVGPSGEEIYTDQYGRVKVQFHWDRYGKMDENSSCWIRVAQPWAGKSWGMMAIPRIGQEVVVEFLEGDPDRPLITGSVYNNSQMPPYSLPANKTQSGIKSRSSKGGQSAHFNEIRFEDKKGSEQVYIHAEKNLDTLVENCESHSVGANRAKTIGHDETTHVKHNRTETVDHNETVTVGKDIRITAGDSITLTVGASTLVMKSNGSITLNGINLDVTGSEHIQLDSTRIDLN